MMTSFVVLKILGILILKLFYFLYTYMYNACLVSVHCYSVLCSFNLLGEMRSTRCVHMYIT